MTTAPAFDAVHDLQTVFRSLLEAFSFPNRTTNLATPASRLAQLIPQVDNPALAAACIALIDSETAYHVVGSDPLEAFLLEWCASRPGTAENAAFLVLPRFDDELLASLLRRAPLGTLADPHLGATVLVGVDTLQAGTALSLHGPGLDGPKRRVLPEGPLWLAERNRCVAEYPLGVDLVFVDRDGGAAVLPRTTRVSKETD